MSRFALLSLLVASVMATPSWSDTVVAKHLIRPGTTITSLDIVLASENLSGGASMPEEVVGLEAKSLIYPGRPLGAHNLRLPAIIERNSIVTVHFARKGLAIKTEGRALERAGVGESVKVMNLDSRTTLTGLAMSNGSVLVAQ